MFEYGYSCAVDYGKNQPKWMMHNQTIKILNGELDDRMNFEYNRGRTTLRAEQRKFNLFRGSCSGYIKKSNVRLQVMIKYKYSCAICGSKENLTIDHIKSVYRCWKEKDIHRVNSLDNLQVLCRSCNSKKACD